mmetsp:Transcript_19437/g.34488  ORF Transcript_19437/g.34488 Transcript_19437/m.34488 type:complete len:554 (-) Transcript_19437:355-2016(-)
MRPTISLDRHKHLRELLLRKVDAEHQKAGFSELCEEDKDSVREALEHQIQLGHIQDHDLKNMERKLRTRGGSAFQPGRKAQGSVISSVVSDHWDSGLGLDLDSLAQAVRAVPTSTNQAASPFASNPSLQRALNFSAKHGKQRPLTSIPKARATGSSLISGFSKVSKASSQSRPNSVIARAESPHHPPPRRPHSALHMDSKLANMDVWAQLAITDVKAFKEETEQQEEKRRQKVDMQRQALDAQVQYRQQLNAMQREMEIREARQEAENVAQWVKDQEFANRQKKVALAAEAEARRREFTQVKAQKENEAQARRREEEEQQAQIRSALALEQQQRLERRMKAKEDLRAVQEANDSLKLIREEERKKNALLELSLQEQHMQVLERQEQAQKDAVAEMRMKSLRRQKKAAFIPAKTPKDKAAEIFEKAQGMERAFGQEEIARQARLRAQRGTIKQILADQVQERNAAKEREKEHMERIRLQVEKDAKIAGVMEWQKKQHEKQRNMVHREQLVQQIESKKQKAPGLDMTSAELSMNSAALDRLKIFSPSFLDATLSH